MRGCLQGGETVKQLPCQHLYHSPCIDNWLVVSKVRCIRSRMKSWLGVLRDQAA